MKSLIAVFTYCPDTQRKLILNELLLRLQSIRDKFDIIVLSHSEVPETTKELSDFTYIESENNLIYDFDLRNKFWFKAEKLFVHSSLVYQFSTHLSIYSLVHYVINFARFKNYRKVHCVEYDLKMDNLDLVERVDFRLENFDNVMFRSKNGWIHGTYFAFKIDNFPNEYFVSDKNFILKELTSVETNMTEHYTPKFLSINDRTTHFEPSESIADGSLQKKDSHGNDDLNWCVPILEKDTDNLYFFVFNEKSGEHEIDIIYNKNHMNFNSGVKGTWKIIPIGKISVNCSILILIDRKVKHDINLNDENLFKFSQNNFFYWK